jgi:hypothetical protein
MRAKSAALGVLFAMAPMSPVLAQQPSSMVEINFQQPKPGMTRAYEAGRKKHMAWHKSQKDTWSWFTWEVVSGEGTGSYVIGTFQHAWKEFDGREKFDQADSADFAANVGASVAHSSTSYYVQRPDISLSPMPASPSPTPLISVTVFTLKPESVNDFVEAVKKINEGIKKTNYPQSGPSHWYQLVNGGEGPSFVLVADRASWAAFQPNEKTLDAMMDEAYGKEQGAAILASLRKAIRTINSQANKYRPDLSYVAPKLVAAAGLQAQ